MSEGLQDKLTMPQCFPQFELTNQILPISATPLPVYLCLFYCGLSYSTDLF